MRNATIGIMMLVLGLSWLACNKADKPKVDRSKLAVEEITPDRQKLAGHLIKETEVPLEPGWYDFMPVHSDEAVYIRYGLTQREITLNRFDFNLSQMTSTSFREGKGPGEWICLPEFVGFDDTILMIDPAESRITWFNEQMNIVRTLRHNFFSSGGGGGFYSEIIKKGSEEFDIFYFIKNDVGGKQGYYSGYDIKFFGGTINSKELKCKVYYETFQGSQKGMEPVYDTGEKTLFAQAEDSLYIVDAETYTLTRMTLAGMPIRSVHVKTNRPEFSKTVLQKWERGFSKKSKNPHTGMWKPTYWYPSPLWPVAGVIVLGRGLAVITCEDYDPENQPEMLRADYFDLDLNYLGIVCRAA